MYCHICVRLVVYNSCPLFLIFKFAGGRAGYLSYLDNVSCTVHRVSFVKLGIENWYCCDSMSFPFGVCHQFLKVVVSLSLYDNWLPRLPFHDLFFILIFLRNIILMRWCYINNHNWTSVTPVIYVSILW